MSLAAYESEDGLVGHHREERPLGIVNIICPSTGELQAQVRGNGWVGEMEWKGMGDFWDSIGNINEENT